MPTSQYEIPSAASPQVLPWCLEAEQEGRAWIEAQRPAKGWEAALSMLSETMGDQAQDGLSNVGYNLGKRIARELVASLSNFRHDGEYKVTWDDRLYDQAHTLSNLDRNWYRTTYANDAHRAALQYAVATGTGYLLETWDKHFWSPYRGDIRLSAISPADVSFVQMPKNHDIQRAYAVIIREEMPINLAKAIYGETNRAFAESLVPDRDQPGWLAKGLQKLQQFVSPALRVAGRMQQTNATFPTVDIFHMYTLDRSTNEGSTPIPMGPTGANWSYVVPAKGDPLPTGTTNPQTGNFFTIPATDEHCRMYPLRRYTIFSKTGICYDGTSMNWHGEVPLARIRFNDWAWEALGSTLVGETKTMQDGIVALMRGIEDSAAARLDPPFIYDDTLVSSTWAQAFNPRKAGTRAAAPLMQGDPIKFPVDPHMYDVPPWIPDWIKQQEERMKYFTGVADFTAIAKAQQIPGADTLEKLMEMAGPIVEDLVRQIEHPLQRLGDWRKAYYFQFYTRPRMLSVTGPEGVDIDVKYMPEQLRLIEPNVSPEMRMGEVQRSLDEFYYHVTESGVNEIHRMSNKLLYLQLTKLGFPISWWTIANVCKIPNFGPPPKGTNTEIERFIAQKHIETDLMIDQQQRIAEATAPQMGGLPPAGPPNGAAAPNGNGAEGRPPSFNAPPRLEQKSDPSGGNRTTISTSR